MELTTAELEALKYPNGKFSARQHYTYEEVKKYVDEIAQFPVDLMKLSSELKEGDYKYSYRPGGWTIAQLIHHIADSHLNAYIRIKLTLTESSPVVKPYDENLWAAMPDANEGNDAHVSVIIISGIHHRMSKLLHSLDENAFEKNYFHPQYNQLFNLGYLCALYAWHGAHHLAQIRVALERKFI